MRYERGAELRNEFFECDRHGDNPVVDQLADVLDGGVKAGIWAISELRFTAVMLFHAMRGAVVKQSLAIAM